jgi:hypothetical protein
MLKIVKMSNSEIPTTFYYRFVKFLNNFVLIKL